jgi:hypothetical protein
MASISDIELEIAENVSGILRKSGLLREGYRCDVHLHGPNRKKRRDAEFEGNWNPDADSIRIAFSPTEEEDELASRNIGAPAATSKADLTQERLRDLVRALDRAESRPGYDFVSLKWFRDSALAHEDFPWAADVVARHDILREAIDRRWVLTRKVANPRPPNFPVTAIQLNRLMPEVSAALGRAFNGPPAFRPVKIRGESLSATVLHDRR